MPLKIYRRHNQSCSVHTLKMGAKDRRYYLDCQCPLWITGPGVPRTSLETTDLKVAEAKRQRLIADAGDAAVLGIRIRDAIDKFMAARKISIGDDTAYQYRLLLDRLADYCSSRGAGQMSELTVDLLEDFKIHGLPDIMDTTRKVAVVKLKTFLREALRREWIAKPLAEQVSRYEATHEEKEPYTDTEVSCILAGALKVPHGGRGKYAKYPETFRLLLELMLETGMRVSDAVRFDPRLLRKGDSLWVYAFTQQKRKRGSRMRTTEVFLTDRLKSAIAACQWLSPEFPFWFASTKRLPQHVRGLMKRIGRDCEIAECRPHRLRDTFAVRALLRGVAIGDVSKLLGHSSVRTTEEFYAKWNTARANRLEGIAAQAFVDAPGDVLRDAKDRSFTTGQP
jgi:integrase